MSTKHMADLKDQIRQFCSEHHLKLNTDLGQHFLIDETVLEKIVDAGDIQPDEHIVEIGPGIGVLTKELLKKAAKVTAIELDERMIPLLKHYCELSATNYQLQTHCQNALEASMPVEPYKIIANIPYHITSPLLRHAFLESQTPPKSMTLLIQKEVADRICDTKNTDLLTIVVGLFGKATKVIDVPPECFLPPPKVDSAVIHIKSYEQPIADAATIEQVMKFAKIAFSQKRKMLRNSLGDACLPAGRFPGGLELLSAAHIDAKRRPQTLSVDEWVALAQIAMQD